MAYLVRIKPEPCKVCPKLAVVTLYDKHGVKQGDYCQYHGDMFRIELKAQEYYEADLWHGATKARIFGRINVSTN